MVQWFTQFFVVGAIFIVSAFSIWVVYHLLVDEDDPAKLEEEQESFERDWQELCSRL